MPVIFEIKVTPSSGRSAFVLDKSGKLKAFLKSPPEGGKANRELIKLLSRALKCHQSSISIVGGATFRNKKIKLDQSLSYDEILSKLGLAIQTNLLTP